MAIQRSRAGSLAVKPAPVEPERRHYGPRTIATLLAPIVRPALRRHGAALVSLYEAWPGIVGTDVAARSRPVKCAAGTLTIGCAGPDALELQHAEPALIGRANQVLGSASIMRVRFTDTPGITAAGSVRSLSNRRDRREHDRIGRHNGDALLPDGPLGDALARLWLNLQRRGDTSG